MSDDIKEALAEGARIVADATLRPRTVVVNPEFYEYVTDLHARLTAVIAHAKRADALLRECLPWIDPGDFTGEDVEAAAYLRARIEAHLEGK